MVPPLCSVLLFFLPLASAFCPECKEVTGDGDGAGTYRLANSESDRCPNGCVYTKETQQDDSFCFTPGSAIYSVSSCDEEVTEMTQIIPIDEDGSIFNQTVTLRSDKMLIIEVPEHNSIGAAVVVMDRKRNNRVIKTARKCLISRLPQYVDTEQIFKDFQRYSGQQRRQEKITTIMKEGKTIPSHLEFQSVYVQQLCQDEDLVQVTEENVTQEQFELLTYGEVVAIGEDISVLPQPLTGCSTFKTVVTRVTPDHCFYIYSSDVTFHHLGTSTLVVDCCTAGTDPLEPGTCWCADITEANILSCGGANILTVNTCGATFQSDLTHVENFDGGWKQSGPAGISPGETCQYNVQKLLPTGTCTFTIEFEVLDLTLNPSSWPVPSCTGSDWLFLVRGPAVGDPTPVGLFQICGHAAGAAPVPVDISGCPQPLPALASITVNNAPASVTLAGFSVNADLQIRVRADATTYNRKWAFKVKQECV